MSAPDQLHARILVVDDEPANILFLERLLAREGYMQVVSCTNPREVTDHFARTPPDILLLDLHMPGLSGFEILEQLHPALMGHVLPVVVLTADATPRARLKALESGATDFLTKPLDAAEVLLRIRNHLRARFLHLHVEAQVRARTEEVERGQIESLERLAQAAEFRDDDTGQHTRRVGEMSARLAKALGFADSQVALLRRAAPLHDVGKIGIPDAILNKPGRLTPDEMAVMRTHATIGASILAGSRSELVVMAEQIALSHHERWDGGGYPHGLREDAIPLTARVVTLADFHDALSSDRPYRPAWPADRVVAEIRRETGAHFDPVVAEAFLDLGALGPAAP